MKPSALTSLLVGLALAVTIGLAPGPTRAAEPEPPSIRRLVAVKDVCAWPALTLLPDGSINATLFGQPSHGQVAGSIEVWNSPDGEVWTKRGVPAPNEPDTNRMGVSIWEAPQP